MRDRVVFYRKRKKDELTHSRGYDRYFEGYVEYAKAGEKKSKIKRLYMGDYHRHAVTDGQWSLLRLLYCCLFILAAVLFITVLAQPLKCNNTWYVALPSFASIFTMFMLLGGVIFYITTPRKMTIYEYRSSTVKIKRWSKASAISMAAQSVMYLVFIVFNFREEPLKCLLLALLVLPCAAAVYAIGYIESKIQYETVENTNQLPDGVNIYKVTGVDMDKLLNHETVDD